MKAIDDILFDSGLGSNNSFNDSISQEIFNGGGGGGGGAVSTGGGSSVVLTNTPGTPLSNETYIISVASDIPNASILINGENTYKTTPNTVNINLSDILGGGDRVITVEKSGYKSSEKYIVSLVPNTEYNLNIDFNINPASSIFGGIGGNFGVSGLAMFNSLPSMDLNNPTYSNTPYYKLSIKYFYNEFEQSYSDIEGKIKDISFKLESNNVTPIEDINVVQSTTISLEGSDDSAVAVISDGNSVKETIRLKSGINSIVAEAGSFITIQTANINSYRVKTIEIQSGVFETKTLSSASDTESISTRLTLDGSQFGVSVYTEAFETISENTPVISLIDTEKLEYNINSKSDVPIGILKSSNTTSVELRINNIVYNFNDLGDSDRAIILIPSKVFTTIGNYKVILIPKQNGTSRLLRINATDGNPIEFTINVVDAVYVGVPDIRNIQYPSLIKGPDYIGANVDFIISYETVNTDYVKIYKVGSSTFIRAGASGEVSLNFLQLLTLDGTQPSQSDDLISMVLKLVPYNEQGREVVIGKEEFITIQLDKGDITIPRDTAIARIADGFISQFDDNVFDDESSKYLTHLLHLGQGDNKVVTTWVGSDSSLILKLYEPLPTSVQPNQQVWISKLQSNPIVETITINGFDESYCPPLKGPNFTLEESNGVAYQVFDELIASGSETSTNLINRYLESSGIDTTILNIEYVSGSTYMFDNFSHFGSAEERVNNFFYKINLLETYKLKYEGLTSTYNPQYSEGDGGLLAEAYDNHIDLTLDGAQIITQDGIFDIQWERAQFTTVARADEAKKLLETINGLIRSLDGFENFLYKSTNDLAYPKELYVHPITGLGTYILRQTNHSIVTAWYQSLVDLASEYDKYNPDYLVNNIPEFIREDYNNNDFLVFLDMIGQHFDIVWAYITNLSKTKNLEHKQVKGFSNKLVSNLLQSFGWNPKKAFNSPFLWEYAFGQYKDGFQKYSMSLADANDEVWRRILNNLPYLLKHKGTARAMKAIMACYGVPQSMLTIMEFGGPQDPTSGGVTQFTFDDRTAAISLDEQSSIIVPWHEVQATLDYPNCIEFRIRPSANIDSVATLISGSEFTLDLVQTTGSFYKLELNFGGDESTSTYFETTTVYISPELSGEYAFGPDLKTGSFEFPLSNEHYSNVAINRHNNPDSSSWYEVWLGTSNGSRIITSVSMSMMYNDSQWTGSTPNLVVGGNGYAGELDEFRLWTVPLQRSKFENHTLFPDAINGNDYDSSTKDLMFRLDFEYPKDRTITENIGIKNVAISDNYNEPFASASNMYSASAYPYQYIPYDRTVTANVPSLGFNVSNKIRFETQTLTTDLSYKQRATKKSFDRAPIDSNRLGLFFSPIKELNMDILKAFGDFNIDNYIGDPSDEYKNSYRQLDILRGYYFERLDNRDIYEYIRLVKYIDKSLFEVLSELAPARTNISKGLLIEPHYLERSKTLWNKPESLRNDFATSINTQDDIYVDSESIPKDANLDIQNVATFDTTISNNNGIINLEETTFETSNPNYETSITATNQTLEASAPMYSVAIQVPTGSSLSGEADSFTFTEIGMDRNSLANRGYGLYAKQGVSKTYYYDDVFGNHTGSRESVFIVKEQYTQKINTQIAGYPTTRSLIFPGERVRYVKVPTTKYKYKVSSMAWSGSISIGNEVVEVQALNGYLPTHYKFVSNLSEGMKRSYFMGSQQTALTTPDGLGAVETFTTNPNILRVAKTGRGSGEPILEVD